MRGSKENRSPGITCLFFVIGIARLGWTRVKCPASSVKHPTVNPKPRLSLVHTHPLYGCRSRSVSSYYFSSTPRIPLTRQFAVRPRPCSNPRQHLHGSLFGDVEFSLHHMLRYTCSLPRTTRSNVSKRGRQYAIGLPTKESKQAKYSMLQGNPVVVSRILDGTIYCPQVVI